MLELIDGELKPHDLQNPALMLAPDWFCIAETDNDGLRGWICADYRGNMSASPMVINSDDRGHCVEQPDSTEIERIGSVYLQAWSMLQCTNALFDFIETPAGGRVGIVLDIWHRLRTNYSHDACDLWMSMMLPLFGRQKYFHKFSLLDTDSAPFGKNPEDVYIRADMEEPKRRVFEFMQLHQNKTKEPLTHMTSGMVRSFMTMTGPDKAQTDLPCPVCGQATIGSSDNTFFCAAILSAMCAVGIEHGDEAMALFGSEVIMVDSKGDTAKLIELYPENVDEVHFKPFNAAYKFQMYDGVNGLRTYETVLSPKVTDEPVTQKEEDKNENVSKEDGHVIH